MDRFYRVQEEISGLLLWVIYTVGVLFGYGFALPLMRETCADQGGCSEFVTQISALGIGIGCAIVASIPVWYFYIIARLWRTNRRAVPYVAGAVTAFLVANRARRHRDLAEYQERWDKVNENNKRWML